MQIWRIYYIYSVVTATISGIRKYTAALVVKWSVRAVDIFTDYFMLMIM